MPRPLHLGRPTTTVIPEGWSAVHAAVIDGTHDCTVSIGPAGGTLTFTRGSGTAAAPAEPVYVGPATVALASTTGSGEGRAEAADDLVDEHAYQVKLPTGPGAPDGVDDVAVDHVITVTDSPAAALTGTRLVVVGVSTPGREFSRVISARLYA